MIFPCKKACIVGGYLAQLQEIITYTSRLGRATKRKRWGVNPSYLFLFYAGFGKKKLLTIPTRNINIGLQCIQRDLKIPSHTTIWNVLSTPTNLRNDELAHE